MKELLFTNKLNELISDNGLKFKLSKSIEEFNKRLLDTGKIRKESHSLEGRARYWTNYLNPWDLREMKFT